MCSAPKLHHNILDKSNTDPSMFQEATTDEDPSDGFYTPARDSKGRLIRDEQTVNVFLLRYYPLLLQQQYLLELDALRNATP